MPSRKELMQVQSENWKNNGGGGAVDPKVMKDIGFTPFDEFNGVVEEASRIAQVEIDGQQMIPEAAPSQADQFLPRPQDRVVGRVGLMQSREKLSQGSRGN